MSITRILSVNKSTLPAALIACFATVIIGCAGQQVSPVADSIDGRAPGDVDNLLVVDCLLPGQLRQLGQRMTFLTPRRPIKTSASECAIRGGEFTSYDRANFATALKIWMPLAQQGDPEAQTYVGEIYEKGLGLEADHALAAQWYRKAADSGYSRAQINLGFLYESGLGVKQDLATAMNYYRAASGFEEGELEYVSSIEAANRKASKQTLIDLQAQVAELEATNAELERKQAQIGRERTEVASLREEIKQQRALLAKAPAAASGAANGENADPQHAQRIAKLAGAISELEKTNSELEAANARQLALIDRLNERQAQTGELRRELTASNAEYGSLASDLKRKERQVENLSTELAQLRAGDGARDAAAEQRIQTLEQELAEERSLVGNLRSEVERVRSSQSDASREIEQRLAKSEEAERALKQQLEQQLAELTTLNESLADQQARYDEEIAALQGQLETSRDEQTRIGARLAEAQLENAELGELASVQQAEIDSLEAELAKRQASLDATDSASAEATELAADVQALQGELATARDEQRRLNERMMQAQIQAQDERAQAALKLAALEQQLASKQLVIDEQQEEIGGLQKRITEARATMVERDMEKVSAVAAVGPTIEIIEPPVLLSRGAPALSITPGTSDIEVIGRIDPIADLLTFKINGRKQTINDNGVFQHTVRTADTSNLQLVAVNNSGQRTDLAFEIYGNSISADQSSTLEATVDTNSIDFGNYHALIIGNNKYSGFHDLKSAENDAIAMDRLFRERYGFTTELMLNATRYDILSAMNRARDTLTEQDNLVIYYAGHGELANGKGYWMPVDAEPNNTSNWISNSSITDLVESMSAKHVMVIADSCYSGSLSRSSLTRLQAGMSATKKLKWYKSVAALKVRTVLSSGGVKPVLDSAGNSQHSIFAQALLDELGDADGVVEAYDLFLKVQGRVKNEAMKFNLDQNPQYSPIQHAGHESGEFLFVGKGTATARANDNSGPLALLAQ